MRRVERGSMSHDATWMPRQHLAFILTTLKGHNNKKDGLIWTKKKKKVKGVSEIFEQSNKR